MNENIKICVAPNLSQYSVIELENLQHDLSMEIVARRVDKPKIKYLNQNLYKTLHIGIEYNQFLTKHKAAHLGITIPKLMEFVEEASKFLENIRGCYLKSLVCGTDIEGMPIVFRKGTKFTFNHIMKSWVSEDLKHSVNISAYPSFEADYLVDELPCEEKEDGVLIEGIM